MEIKTTEEIQEWIQYPVESDKKRKWITIDDLNNAFNNKKKELKGLYNKPNITVSPSIIIKALAEIQKDFVK